MSVLQCLEHKLASDMVKVKHWCFLNKMVLNTKKKKDYVDHNLPEASETACKNTVNNQALESVTSEKLLGVVLDQNLTWKGHVDKVHRTVSMLL